MGSDLRLIMPLAGVLLASIAPASAAVSFSCPQPAAGRAPIVLSSAEIAIFKSDDRAAMTAGINDVSNRLRARQTGMSYAHIVDAIIAARCPLVASRPDLSNAQKREQVRRFSALVARTVPVEPPAAGALILTSVPLAPAVFDRLSVQAAAANQSTTAFIAQILSQAAGN